MPIALRVLLIEDSEDDAELVLRELRAGGYEPTWRRVDTIAGLRVALREQPWDVITCDYVLPRLTALDALRCIRELPVDLPVIIVSGRVDEEVAVTAMKAGAHDYVSKRRLARLVPAIERELADMEARVARRQAEEAARASRERYRELVETVNDVIFELDAEGRITFLSPAIESFSHYRAAELLGRQFTTLIHPDDLAAVLASLQRTLQNAREPAEFRVVDKTGELRWVRTFSRPIFADGRFAALRGVLTDITARKEAEAVYRAVFEHSLQGLEVWQDGQLVLGNPALSELTGYGIDELKAMPPLESIGHLIHPDDRAAVGDATRRWLAGGGTGPRTEFRIVRKDGSVRRVMTGNNNFLYRGRPATLVAWVDITDRWRAETALRQLNSELEARVVERTAQLQGTAQELEAFSYSVSHDLRAPLRAIDGFTQAVIEDAGGQLPAVCSEHLRRVRRATQRMGELIDQLLVLSRVMRGELRRQRVDLSALARDVAAELTRNEPQRRVALAVAEGLVTSGDAALLRAVLANLLGNAWKFTRPRAQPCIELGCRNVDRAPAYYVRDNGVGFDMEYATKLFRPFQRLHEPDEFDGSGIGLATVQRIVQRHGGKVWAEGAVGQGATFFFTLGG
jgi:PAS domain S-box-containing protein